MNVNQYKITKLLIWVYLFFLIFEGSLRKWVLPSLSNPLLIIRDPIVILIYLSALMDGSLLKRSGWIITIVILAAATLVAGLLAQRVNFMVMAFGFRTNFLHLPLIFVMATALTREDVHRFGKWFLILSVPMAFLMVAQFRTGPGHWLNAGAGEGSGQIISAMGKVRASGTFSFITGPVSFFALTAAFLLYGQVQRSAYPLWLVAMSTMTLILAAASAGSRSLLAEVMIVGVFFGIGLVLHPPSFSRAFRVVIIGIIGYLAVSLMDIFREASAVMKTRIELASTGTYSGTEGYIRRIKEIYNLPLLSTPLFGKGFGLGTNAGAALIGVRRTFLVAESEWARVIGESGPVLGLAFIVLRIILAGAIARMAVGEARSGNLMPILLLGASAFSVISGQFGPPTILGFAVFSAGCAMAAVNSKIDKNIAPDSFPAEKGPRRRATASHTVVEPSRAVARSAPPRAISQPGRWAVRPANTNRYANE